MKRMRRVIAAVVLTATLVSPGGMAVAEDEEKESTREAPHYESPVLSLLFLPFNLLIRMASTLEPDKRRDDTKHDDDS